MDKAAIADQIIQESLDKAIQAHRQRATMDTGHSDPDCTSCGNEIPAARRKALPGCKLCVECAQASESRNKHFNR